MPANYHLNLDSVKKPKGEMFRYDRPRTGRASTALGTRRSTSRASNTIHIGRSIEIPKENSSKVKQILRDRIPFLDKELANKIARVIEESGITGGSIDTTRQKVKTDSKWARASRNQVTQDAEPVSFMPKETDPELKDLFLRSVESVRKEIARRRRVNSQNFFKQSTPITVDQFKNMDFVRVMELVLANPKMLETLHHCLLVG